MQRPTVQEGAPGAGRTRPRRRRRGTALRDLAWAVLGLATLATPVWAAHLTFLGATFDVPPVSGLDGVAALAVSPDGRHVYAGAGLDNAVTAFGRDAATGALRFIDVQREGVGGVDGLANVFGLAISPDGGNVYATSYNDHAIAVFRRDAASGRLTFVEVQHDEGLFGAAAITVSPDGRTVYAGGFVLGTLVVFARAAETGALTFLERHHDGVDGVDGLQTIRHVTVSPDGRHVYAVGRLDNALAAFARDPATGRLTYLTVYRDGVGGIDGLAVPYAVTVSPDGAHVYATSFGDRAVSVFARDATTGLLTFLQVLSDGVDGVDGLDWPYLIRLGPDGRYVYVIGQTDNALAVFARDPASGRLTFVEVHKDGVDGVAGLASAEGLAVSPDGAHVYTCGFADDAIGVFAVEPAACPAAPATGCTPATRSALRFRISATGGSLHWRWTGTPNDHFGDPRQNAGFAFCLYAGATRLLELALPADATWEALSGDTYRYRVNSAVAPAIRHLVLGNGPARVSLLAGAGGTPPTALPLAVPVIAQLRGGGAGACWEAAYGPADIQSNAAGRFSARSNASRP
jgi:6-phosphogluconolactonase (cycloisomerase 2 family)